MYKNIIPSLISFDTTLSKLTGFYYSDNFDYYLGVRKKSQFHYSVFINNNIEIPKKYDFRNGYFIKSGNRWYYERKLGLISLKFCFDSVRKTFSFNRLYTFIPFQIGYIFPVGLQIADFINLDLFLSGITSLKGCAYNYNNKNICVLAPGFNGKTRLIKKVLEKNGKYITEDILLLNLHKSTVYPNSIRSNIFARKVSRDIKNLLTERLITEPKSIDEIFLVQNFTTNNYVCQNKNFFDFFNMCRVPFNANQFIRSYIFEELLTKDVDAKMDLLKKENTKLIFKQIKEFNYKFLET